MSSLTNGIGLLLLITSVSCTSIVQKPEINLVKKVAVLSLYGNDRIYREGHSQYTSDWNPEMKQAVAERAYQEFTGEFKKLGWTVIEASSVLNSADYQAAFKPVDVGNALGLNKDSTLGRAVSFLQAKSEEAHFDSFFALKGMYPIRLAAQEGNTHYYGDSKNTNPKAKLGEMAKKLGVDAVVLVEMRYCYTGGMLSLAGNGQAFLTVDGAVRAVNQKGELVVNMPEIAGCGAKAIETDTGVGMIGGKLILASMAKERFTAMFNEANGKIAKRTVATIRDAMN